MSTTLVRTRYGQVKGEQIEAVSIWRGIPYTKAPFEDLRFCPPVTALQLTK